MAPSRPLVAGAVVAAFLIAAMASAVVFLGVPQVRLSDTPTAADAVTLYQSGLAFVELSRNFTAGGGDVALTFAVPTSAVFESIALQGTGLVVKELRSAALQADPLVNPGDEVVVTVEGPALHRGSVLSFEEGQLVLATPTGTVVLMADRIVSIELPAGNGTQPEKPGATEVTALVDAPAGNHTVRLSYLARGPGWVPSHALEMSTRALRFEAVLSGLADWENVSLDIVSGSPNVVTAPPPAAFPAPVARAFAEDAAVGEGFAPSVPLGDLHRYHLDRPVTFARGETVRLPVLQGPLDVLRRYYNVETGAGWIGPVGTAQVPEVLERAELRNNLSEPLPAGVVRFYENGTWIGEDNLPGLARGERGNVTLARAEEVDARLVLEQVQSTASGDRTTYRLEVRNHKAQPVDLRAVLTYPTYRTTLLSAEPEPSERLGGQVVWNRVLGPDEEASFRITYETLRDK